MPKTARPIVVPTGTAINVSLQNGNSNKNVEFNPQCEFTSTTSIRNCARGTVSNQQFSIGLSTLKTRQQCQATRIMVSTAPEVKLVISCLCLRAPGMTSGSLILCRCFKRIECISFAPQTIRGIIAWVLSIELHQLFICMPEGGHSGSLRFFLCTSEKPKAKQRTWQEQFARHAPGTSTFWN